MGTLFTLTSRRRGLVLLGLVNLFVFVHSRADNNKDPSLLLRPPGSSSGGPVFSSSIDSIPVHSASSNQQTVFKSPSYSVHSSASASANAGGISEQSGGGSGGARNNNNNSPWYTNNGGGGFTFDEPPSAGTSAQTSVSQTSAGTGYYEQPPPGAGNHGASTITSESYGAPNGGPSYTYYYQHYPTSSHGGGGGWNGGGGGDDGGHGINFGDLSLPGLGGGFGGLGAFGGVKVVKIAAAIIKGIIAAKPILIILLLLLIAFPVLLFLAPIPIITITQQPQILRSARSSSQQLTSYLSQLSGKVLNAEECLERIICKLPQPPEKYQKKAKFLWDEHGSKMVSNQRVVKGLNAYFDSSSQKNRNLKCEQKFKCSNKYL